MLMTPFRHGYAMLFFDRQWLLQVLYDKIQHKDRILLNSQVKTIDCRDSGVQISTRDGQTHRGTMVVGADGIHSAVRAEMLRVAGETKPGYFPAGEEDRVPCYYQCSFGIAVDVANWPKHEQSFTTGDNKAFLVTSGPKGRVYWFLFVKLPEVKHGKDIPRYTKEDEGLFVKEHQALPITESLTFGQLFSKGITSTLTPLHQVVFEKWFFDRMLLIGDSAHKVRRD
jgi:2-polyprenyl-6-methoxyphenol hydroxylase-like FAD-dependent oxidoreductase